MASNVTDSYSCNIYVLYLISAIKNDCLLLFLVLTHHSCIKHLCLSCLYLVSVDFFGSFELIFLLDPAEVSI